MLPKYHIIFGIIFIALLFFFSPNISILGLLTIFLSSILIDVDHVFYFFLRKKDLNPIHAYNWYMKRRKFFLQLSRAQRKKIYSGFYFFHGIELLILFFILGTYLNSFFFLIGIGFSFHFMTDFIHEIYEKGIVDKSSLIWNYFRWRKLEN